MLLLAQQDVGQRVPKVSEQVLVSSNSYTISLAALIIDISSIFVRTEVQTPQDHKKFQM